MNWEDEGFLLSKRKFRENANIINVFTSSFGKMSGIVYGGNSRKIRNFLQVGNKIFVFHNAKNDNRIGYFKTEIIKPIAPKYFNDKKRTTCLLSITSLLNTLLPEAQSNNKIYNSVENLISNFDLNNWIILYIFWELNLIKDLGFGTDLKKFLINDVKNELLINVDIDGNKYQIPKYLINNTIPKVSNNEIIKKSLIFNRSILLNKFFLPNNLIFPKSRIIFENYFS